MSVAILLAAVIAIPLPTVLATLFAAAIPNRVGQHLDELDRRHWVVALDHQLARTRALLIGAVLNDDPQTRTRLQRRREGIVQQPPVPAPALEPYTRHPQGAVARVADRKGAVGATAC